MEAPRNTTMDHILDQLSANGVMNLGDILAELPELAAAPNGADVVRLLLRLDRRVQPLSEGRWVLTAKSNSMEQRIAASAAAFLGSIPGHGALIASVVSHVASDTNYDESIIRSTVLRLFLNNGKVVRNKFKGAK